MAKADALNAVGWYSARVGDYDTARDNPRGESATEDSLGYIDHLSGHHHQAIDHYRRALALRRDYGNTYRVAGTLERLGHTHAALGQHEQTRTVWRDALQLYRDQHHDDDAARVQRQLDDLDGEEPAAT